MAAQQIPNQSNINAVIESIVNNVNITQQIISATATAIAGIVKKQKNLDDDLKQFKKLKTNITNFCDITSVIIKSLCTDLPDGKSLGDLLGRTVGDPDKKGNKQISYTVVDSVAQIVNIIDSTFSIIEKISSFEAGFRKVLAIKQNIKILKFVVADLLKDLTNVFADIASNDSINNIINSLVKQPDKTIENIKKNIKQNGEYNLTDNTTSGKTIIQGKLGLLDVFEKTFSLVGLMANLKLPNLMILRISMKTLTRALKMVFNDLLKFTNAFVTDNLLNGIQRLGGAIMGDGNEGKNAGIFKIISKLQMLIPALNNIYISRKQRRRINRSLRRIGSIFNKIVELIDVKLAGTLDNKNFSKRLSIITANVENIGGIISAVMNMVTPSIVINMTAPIIIWAIRKIGNLINAVNTHLSDKTLNDIPVLDQLVDITKNLRDISVNLVITGLVAIPAMLAMLIILPFVGILGLFIVGLYTLSTLIEIVADETRDNLGSINKLILSLMLVGVAILLFALATPIIVWAIQDNVLPFILILAGAIAIVFVMSFIAKFMAKFAQDNMLQASISLIIIMSSLIMAAMVMLVAAGVGAILRNTDSVLNIVIMIGGMIAISAIAVGLGIALSFASPYIGWAMAGLAPLVGLLALIMVTGLTIVGLSKLKFDVGQYKAGKDYANGDIGTGDGIIGNVGLIMGFVKFLTSKLADFDRKDIKKMRQSKRLMRQVSKTTKQIVKIADSLNHLKDIKLDQDKILANVSTIFTFIQDLESKIQDFMKPEGLKENDGTIKTAVTNIFKQAVNDVRKRQEMRQANRTLNKVEKVVTTLNDIGDALAAIGELKMEEPFKKLITDNVGAIFTFINELDTHIATFMVADINPEDIVDAEKLSKKEWKKANKKLSKVEATIATIQGIGDALTTIKDLKLDAAAQESIKTNVELALGSVESIAGIITGKTGKINIDEDEIEKLTPLLDYITALNNGFKGIDNADPVKVEKNIGNYIKFVDKVNSVQVEKVQKTAQMFEQMSKFSTSIKGDFDKLAESLSEKLLPVLEELKEVMGVLPEKIDNGFQNTSASIAAVNAAPTTENVTAQVNRENPNLTKEQVDAMVKTRINEKAQADANGMNAKLDELISLLKGFGGDTVVVRTL